MSTVLQPWVELLPWKLQSILFSGLRGPDTDYAPRIKEVSRWMRKVSQNDADPSQSYMAPTSLPTPEQLEKELEFCTAHFVHHIADALRVISLGYMSNDEADLSRSGQPVPLDKATVEVMEYAKQLHYYIADELFHFVPEDDEVFMWRHRDRVSHP